MVYIYGLVDPRDGIIKYVGRSIDPLRRYEEHMAASGWGSKKGDWLEAISRLGLGPDLIILEVCPEAMAPIMERLYYAAAESVCWHRGTELTNVRFA